MYMIDVLVFMSVVPAPVLMIPPVLRRRVRVCSAFNVTMESQCITV
jgi:hypothetical protein